MTVREWPFWENKSISRTLQEEGINAVMAHLVASGSGEWLDAAKSRCRIYYRTPAEWASKLYSHVESNAMTASVYTLYELHSGGSLYGTGEYHCLISSSDISLHTSPTDVKLMRSMAL